MAKDKASPENNQWQALKRAAGQRMRVVLGRLLDRTVALHHEWYGDDAYELLLNHPLSVGRDHVDGVVTENILSRFKKGKLNFSTEKAFCALAACNLVAFVNEVHKLARTHDRQGETDRRRELAKALEDINVDEIYERCYMEEAPTIIGPYADRCIQALRADSSPDAHAVLELMRTRTALLSDEIKNAWPDLFQRSIGPILGERMFMKIAEPLFEPACLNKFRTKLEKPRREADGLIGFGQFIPCSLESIDLLRAHHQGLAERLFGDDPHRKAWVERFNTLGEVNSAGTRAALRAGAIRDFCHVMKRSALEKLVGFEEDFKYVNRKCLSLWRQELLELDREFRGKIWIWVVAGDDEALFTQKLGDAESTFFYTRGDLAVSATTRWPSGVIHIVLDQSEANKKLLHVQRIMRAGRKYSLSEFDQFVGDMGA